MYLYNTTFKVELKINNDFLYFIKNEVYLELGSVATVADVSFFELLNVDASDGNTFCLHIYFKNLEDYNQYKITHENKLLNNIYHKYSDSVLFFSSLLKYI